MQTILKFILLTPDLPKNGVFLTLKTSSDLCQQGDDTTERTEKMLFSSEQNVPMRLAKRYILSTNILYDIKARPRNNRFRAFISVI